MAGDVAAGVAGFLFSSWDEDTYDESSFANYLGIDGRLGAGFSASQRLQYTCLRAKGYKVEANPENWVIHNGQLYVTQRSFGPEIFRKAPDRWAIAAQASAQVLDTAQFGSGISWW